MRLVIALRKSDCRMRRRSSGHARDEKKLLGYHSLVLPDQLYSARRRMVDTTRQTPLIHIALRKAGSCKTGQRSQSLLAVLHSLMAIQPGNI